MLRSEILPAVAEIVQLTDSVVDVALVRAPSLKKGGGRVIAIDVLVDRAERQFAKDGIALPEPAPSAEIVAFARPGLQPFRPRPMPKTDTTPSRHRSTIRAHSSRIVRIGSVHYKKGSDTTLGDQGDQHAQHR